MSSLSCRYTDLLVSTQKSLCSTLYTAVFIPMSNILRRKSFLCYAPSCRPSLKRPPFLTCLFDPGFFAFKVLLKQNRLHLVCYAAVFLLKFSWVLFSVWLLWWAVVYSGVFRGPWCDGPPLWPDHENFLQVTLYEKVCFLPFSSKFQKKNGRCRICGFY